MIFQELCPIAPVSDDERHHIKKQLTRMLFFRVVLITTILGAMVLLYPDNYIVFPLVPLKFIGLFIVAIYGLTIGSATLLPKIPCLKPFVYIQISFDIILTTIIIAFTGGSQSILIITYFFPITCGAFILYRQGALFIAAQASILYFGVLVIEYQQRFLWLFPNSNLQEFAHVLNRFSVPGLIFFLVAFIGAFMAERLQKAECELTQTTLERDRLAILYKQIFDDISTGIITVDDNHIITSINQAAQRISGFSEDEANGVTLQEVIPALLEEKKGEIRPFALIKHKDGDHIPVGYSWSRLNMPGKTGHYRIYTMQDLSEIKRLEQQIRQAEKMAAIGRMAAGIAHEFRNPLAAMSGAAQLLEQEIDSNTTSRALMNIIIRESDRLEETIREFLLFSRPSEPVMMWFNLKNLIEETLEMVDNDPDWNNAITVSVTIPTTLDCWGDANQIRQILINLFINSSQAMKNNDAPQIAIKGEEEGHNILLSMRDNGVGISEKNRTSIFDPFFTTREDGTGLGLAIVNQIIANHDGEITVTPASPRGTLFKMALPYP